MVTVVYQLEGEGDKLQYTPIHDNSAQMVKVSLLNTKKVEWGSLSQQIRSDLLCHNVW